MNKTSIEWVKNPDGSQGYTWNPITGCLNHENGLCKGGGFPCYAYKLAHGRLRKRYCDGTVLARIERSKYSPDRENQYDDPFYPRFWEDRLYHPWDSEPKGIFVCDMSDLFGIGIPEEWTRNVLNVCRLHEQNRYYLLTKQPQNLIKFSPFPANCYIGVTVTGHNSFWRALSYLKDIKATVKFLSLEPLLEHIKLLPSPYSNFEPVNKPEKLSEALRLAGISWLIIGACTGSKTEMTRLAKNDSSFLTEMPFGNKWTAQPNPECVTGIIKAADNAGIPIFLKDNLNPLFEQIYGQDPHSYYYHNGLRQEIP